MSVDEFRTELVIDNLRAKVASLTAENERLRKERDELNERATMAELNLAGCEESRKRIINQHNTLARQWTAERDVAEAEAQRLRGELADLGQALDREHAIEKKHLERALNAERALSSLRELESAARAWAGKFDPMAGRPLDPDYYSAEEIALVAAVDSLPPTPPATEGSDV